MKILVTGSGGLLGRKIVETAVERGYQVFAVYRERPPPAGVSIRMDLGEVEKISELARIKPDVVIHAAAITNVDSCELNRELAWRINAEVTARLVQIFPEAHFIYVSTDYVFDGESGQYREGDPPNPINYYGYTKLRGEEYVRTYSKKWTIARTSAVYGWGPRENFATWLIDSLKKGVEVRVVVDQYVSPTLNTNLAEMLLDIAERGLTGVIHTAGASRVSRYHFALKIAEVFQLDPTYIKPVVMAEMKWVAKRPRDSSLSVEKAMLQLRAKPLDIDSALRVMKAEEGYAYSR
ncbi:MAG: dTDP-4-dehydrorhamnose reductase [Pyrobaculum sp.]